MTSSWEQTLLGPVADLAGYILAIVSHLLSMLILLLASLGVAWGIGQVDGTAASRYRFGSHLRAHRPRGDTPERGHES